MREDFSDEKYQFLRNRMVDDQIARRGVKDPNVLAAMRTVPRHFFVPEDRRHDAYTDGPIPIGAGQTISQPYIVASMTEQLEIKQGDRVLDIGTGCGYQAAVLAEITDQVYTIEVVPELYERTAKLLAELHYDRINLLLGDGSLGWPEAAPFDATLIAAAAPRVPTHIIEQLTIGGRLVFPLESSSGGQDLIKIIRTEEGFEKHYLYEVRFVPMRGEIERN